MSETRMPLVSLAGVSKYFGGVKALDHVSLDFFAGEIVALIGDNGAGKSTLLKILSGLLAADEGELRLGATHLRRLTPRDARRHGLETVHQHLSLCDNLGAAANVVLGQEPVRWRLGPLRILDERRAIDEARRRVEEIGVQLTSYTAPVRRLSGGQRQAIAIARALVHAHRMIMLDEPTAALGVKQTRATLNVVRRVAAQGVAVILISHNLDDVYAVADRIVAMRHGRIMLDGPAASTTRAAAIAALTGTTE